MITADAPSFLRSRERIALGVAGLGTLVALALGWTHQTAIAPAYRFTGIACFEPAIGSLIFVLIYRTSGGRWGQPLLPFFAAGIRLLPWCWLALLPLLWLDPNRSRALAADQPYLHLYISQPATIGRALVYTIIFFLFRYFLDPFLKRPGASATPRLNRWIGPVGLIVLTFMMHLLAVDWLLATEPDWTSTGFPLTWLSGQAVAGLALAVTTAVSAGANPSQSGPNGNAYGIDWGNLLLTTIMFWVYVSFVQLLIIWSGNLPRETVWYMHRWHGAWRAILVAIVGFHFAIPFFLLLSRELKRRASGLAAVALLIFITQMVYVAWMILPSYHLSGVSEYGLAVAMFAAGGGLFINRYLTLTRASLNQEAVNP